MKRNYATLDAIVVVGSLAIVGASIAGLMLLNIPSDNLPIVAGLLGTMLGTVIGGYAGFRWGASTTKADAAEDPQLVEVVNAASDPVPVETPEPR